MDARSLDEILAAHASSGRPYLEFLKSDSLSVGVYVLEADAVDGQSPHAEDEVYVVLEGRSRFTAGDDIREVAPGDVIFVPASVAHRFHDITQDLRLIVVFAPPEYSRATG